MSEKKKKMTAKQTAFVKEYITTLNATEAAMRAYDAKNRNVARVIGTENLAKLSEPIARVLEQQGLTNDYIAKKIKEKMEAKKPIIANGKMWQTEDHTTQLKATELAAKLKGLLKDSVEITGKNGNELVIKIKEDRELIDAREGEIIEDENQN